MLSYPLTQYMFCSPGEGGVALILCRADQAQKYTDTPIYLKAAVVRSRRFGSFEVMAPHLAPERADGPTVDAVEGRVRDGRASAPTTSTWPSSRTPRSAPRSCTWPRTASASTASRSR